MAAEDIGSIYPTKIPGLEDPADIQAALRLYHYGTSSTVTSENEIVANSVVGHIKALDTRIDDIEATGIGSGALASAPTTPDNGFIWVDTTTSTSATPVYATASYVSSAPLNPTAGALWVDSSSSPLTLYVYSGTAWRAIGS